MAILVGKLTKPYGIKGEIKVLSYTDFASLRYKKDNKLKLVNPINKNEIELTVNSYRVINGIDLLSFKSISTPEEIANYSGYEIISNDLVNVSDSFHYSFLLSCSVSYEGKIIGKVVDIINNQASVILRIRKEDNKDLLYPFIDKFIESIDKDNKVIYLKPIQGMI